MKKFLTVLLVIAVMFTFSFGSAFAAGVPSYNKDLAKSHFKLAMDALKTAGELAVAGTSYGYDIDYATVVAHEAEVEAAVLAYCKNTASDYVNEVSELVNVLNDSEAVELKMALVADQYAADKAEALAILGSLDTSLYSTEEMTTAHGNPCYCETYAEHVQYLINDAITTINNNSGKTFSSDSIVDDYRIAQLAMNAYFHKYDGADAESTYLVAEKGYTGTSAVGLGIYELNKAYVVDATPNPDITLADYLATAVAANDAIDAANVAAKKAEIASAYAAFLKTNTEAADKDYAANVKTMLDFLAEEGILTAAANTYFDDSHNATVDATYAAAVAAANNFKAEAARLAAETDANGVLVRDAEDVEDLVVEGLTNLYGATVGETVTAYRTIDLCLTAIDDLYLTLDAEKLAFEKALRKTYIAEFLEEAKEDEVYFPAELEKVEALAAEYLAKVEAVTELEKVDDFDTTYLGAKLRVLTTLAGKIGDIKTAEDVANITAVGTLQSVAQSYANLANGYITKDANKLYDVETGNYAKLDALVLELVGNSGARTAKAIEALSAEAIALAQTLPTVAAVEAADEAADEAVKALPKTTVTVNDKALIDAAIAAMDAYEDMTEGSYDQASAVKTALTKYAYAYNNAIAAQVKTVDKTDKAAIKAIIADVDAFVEAYEDVDDAVSLYDYSAGTGVFGTQVSTLKGYLTAIKDAAAAGVTAAIVAIPVTQNVTEAAVAKVEAARAAYDAYVAEYTDYEDYDYNNAVNPAVTTDGFVADDFDYAALLHAETTLGLNDNSEELAKIEAIASVEGLKITAKSSAKKGSITVKWTVEGDDANVQYYEVRKSTKKNSGFGTKPYFTTTKMTYKNTKGLEAGTRYYFKVRAVAEIDGETYVSDWSNKAYRVAK